jgi:hypothetical protein
MRYVSLVFSLGCTPQPGPVDVTVERDATVVLHDRDGTFLATVGDLEGYETVTVPDVPANAFVSAIYWSRYYAEIDTVGGLRSGDAVSLLEGDVSTSTAVASVTIAPLEGAAEYRYGVAGCSYASSGFADELADLTLSLDPARCAAPVPWVEAWDADQQPLSFQILPELTLEQVEGRAPLTFDTPWRDDWHELELRVANASSTTMGMQIHTEDPFDRGISMRDLDSEDTTVRLLPVEVAQTRLYSWEEEEEDELTRMSGTMLVEDGLPDELELDQADEDAFARSLTPTPTASSYAVAWQDAGLDADLADVFVYYPLPSDPGQLFWKTRLPADQELPAFEWPDDYVTLRRADSGGAHGGALVEVRLLDVDDADEVRGLPRGQVADRVERHWIASLFWL